MTPIDIEVTTRGDVSDHAREQAREKLGDLEMLVKGPTLGVRVVLIQEVNPRISMPARAERATTLQVSALAAHVRAHRRRQQGRL